MTNGNWVNDTRSTYSNDGSGHHLTYLFEMWLNNIWTYSMQYAYTYDANGNVLTSLYQSWENSQWNNVTLGTYTYTANGKVETLVIKTGGNGSWTNASKHTHTFENGYETNWLMQNWSGGLWVNFAQYNYTNDSKGNVLTSLYQVWQNSAWTNYQQSTLTYDANGNELTGYNTQWSNSQWKPADYSFHVIINGNDYYFTGYAINLSYILVTTGIAADNSNIIKGYSLSQNYPNPFNPSTRINYNLPFDSRVTLDVYNIKGERISQLVNKEQPAGNYSVDYGSSKLSSGIYFYRLNAVNKTSGKNFSEIKKMILLK
jgi:hypothetical protein